jgi:hypothetical protein
LRQLSPKFDYGIVNTFLHNPTVEFSAIVFTDKVICPVFNVGLRESQVFTSISIDDIVEVRIVFTRVILVVNGEDLEEVLVSLLLGLVRIIDNFLNRPIQKLSRIIREK